MCISAGPPGAMKACVASFLLLNVLLSAILDCFLLVDRAREGGHGLAFYPRPALGSPTCNPHAPHPGHTGPPIDGHDEPQDRTQVQPRAFKSYSRTQTPDPKPDQDRPTSAQATPIAVHSAPRSTKEPQITAKSYGKAGPNCKNVFVAEHHVSVWF